MLVYPNPILIENGSTTFDLITTLPAPRALEKIDSLVFKLTYQIDGELFIIGSTRMLTPENWDGTTSLNDTATFEKTDFSVPNYTPLYFQMIMFKNGCRKTTELLEVSRFVNEKEER
ncbi:MAG: hypothetical protein AAF616_04810 [Bacteroidota bacterium]